jgi:hypothetical protein
VGPQMRPQTAKSPVFIGSLTVRSDWLMLAKASKHGRKPPKTRGIGIGRFACVCGLSRHPRREPVGSNAKPVGNP